MGSRSKKKARRRREKQQASGAITLQFPESGIFGEQVGFFVRPADASGIPRPDVGPFIATAVLARPSNSIREDRQHKASEFLIGDSHLAIGPPAINLPNVKFDGPVSLEITSHDGTRVITFDVFPNKKGHAERIRTRPYAAGELDDAEGIAFRAISRCLSDLSLQLDIPLHVEHFETRDTVTGALKMTGEAACGLGLMNFTRSAQLEPQLSHFAALYREAVVSNSPNYRYLCFYRILEGLEKRWEAQVAAIVASGARPSRRAWRLPKMESTFATHLNAVFPLRAWAPQDIDGIFPVLLRGKKLAAIAQEELKGIRDDIAHALFQTDADGVGLSIDEPAQNLRVQQRLPVLRFIVRRALGDAFPAAFDGYPPDPTLDDLG